MRSAALAAMTPEERAARKKARVLRSNQHSACRKLLAKSRFAEAEAYATARGFTTAEARLTSWDRGASLPVAPEVGYVASKLTFECVNPSAPGQPIPPAMSNGWPIETRAMIWGTCRNQRQIIIQLEDERHAIMWTLSRRWRLGTWLRVKLDEDMAKGDPRYLPIEGSIE